MTKPTFKQLKKDAEAVFGEYQVAFAGQSRATRDLDYLDQLINRLDNVVEQGRGLLNGSRDPALLSLLETVANNQEIYRNERKAIAQVKTASPAIVEVNNLALQANLIFAKYYRHFAGKNRSSRDLGLLDEIIAQLEVIQTNMEDHDAEMKANEMADNLTVVERNLNLYYEERGKIFEARKDGTLEQRADILAQRANAQFFIYRDCFAGKSRLSRRPGLLERVIEQLTQIKDEMTQLGDEGFKSTQLDRNIEIVDNNITMYGNELSEIKKAHEAMDFTEHAGQLAHGANQVIEEYRENFAGKDRATRDLELLSSLCDQMGDIASEMQALLDVQGEEALMKNRQIVLDSLNLYETEYRRIEELQSKNNES